MIRHQEIGPRIFYTTDAAFEYRSEMGGRVFLPDPVNGEVYWFPMAMSPCAIFSHRLTQSLDGTLCDGRGYPHTITHKRLPSEKENAA